MKKSTIESASWRTQLKTKSGFTLVEMAVAAGIMIIASSIVIVFSQSGGNRLVLTTEQAKIAGALNRAKSLSLQRYKSGEASICGFGFKFNDPIGTYAIFPVARSEFTNNCEEFQDNFEEFTLNRNVIFSSAPSGEYIIFESPYLTVKNPMVIQINLRDNEKETAGVEVTSGGTITLQ